MEKKNLKQKYINISLPSIGLKEWKSLKEPILNGWVTQGPKVSEFEKKFSEKFNFKNSIAVTSCTAGLHLALIALGINKNDEVIVPSFTWVSCANVVINIGAKLKLVDVATNSFNTDFENISKNITKKTKAIIIPHLFGMPIDVDQIKKKIPKNIKIIEDCACAVGAKINNKYCGSMGDIGVFSFHPRKIITTGEGGMIVTSDTKLAKKIDQLRNHGASISEEQRHLGPKPYIMPSFKVPGLNYRMTDLQGSLGIQQIDKLDFLLKDREKWSSYYMKLLEPHDSFYFPRILKNSVHGWQSFVCIFKNKNISRNNFMELLETKGIASRPGTHAIHMLEYYRNKFNEKKLVNSKLCNNQSLALPMHFKMKSKDYKYVVNIIKEILKEYE